MNQIAFFYFMFILALLTIHRSLEQGGHLSAVPEMAQMLMYGVSMNVDLHSSENLFQCRRYLASKSNCISVVCVLCLVQLLLISPTLVILSK